MRVDQPRSDFDLRSLVRIVWRRKLSILVCVIIVLAASMAISLQKQEIYAANAQILVTNQGNSVLNSTTGDPTRQLENEAALATSDQFKALIIKEVGRPIPITAKASE